MANRLINEQSQYLLQHAHNPVNWYPWGDEAFERAEKEHKPVLVSIGYAACHWCHVMERESFENAAVADFMNNNFVCIKVDREEHPDVDHLYMDAVQAIGGSGGWPLNVFVTPARIPFYGGTYYPPNPAYNRPSWMQLLSRMSQIWQTQHDEVMQQANQMISHLRQAAQTMTTKDQAGWNRETCGKITAGLMAQADLEKGGFGNAPKFPGTMAITYLLENYYFTGDEKALDHALHSLNAMADGGIYDQLGGGFSRYATDRNWVAPHFEKMLYDNALLVCAYSDAYALTKIPRYKVIIEETIAFVERELKDASGGYYCALDADSEGVEGKFYTWKWDDFVAALGDMAPLAAEYFGVTPHGNWEETNILHVVGSVEDIAMVFGISEDDVRAQVLVVKQRLLMLRNGRIRPVTDDKCLLSWNALYNTALGKAAAALGNNGYLDRALSHMDWMLHSFETDQGLLHTWKNGVAKIPAKLDDYAFLAQAMLQLASFAGHSSWLIHAGALMERIISGFSAEDGFFYYTSDNQKEIPVRKVDVYDGAIPSANAVMAGNLWICGMGLERADWLERADVMLRCMSGTTTRYGYSFGYWGQLIQRSIFGRRLVVYAGNDSVIYNNELQSVFFPHIYLLYSEKSDEEVPVLKNKFSERNLYIFVCTENACLPPVSSVQQAIEFIRDF